MSWAWFAIAAIWPPAAAVIWQVVYRITPMRWHSLAGDWIGIAAATLALFAIERFWPQDAGAALSLIAAILYWWWKRRRDRKRAPSALGNKARAILAAMKARLRDARKPRPVLRPQPQGAPCS